MSPPSPSSDSAACPRCHRPIPAAAPLGACPHCLLAAGLPTAVGAVSAEGPPPPEPGELAPEFPALDILELLGRGGMGAVYKARQRDLERFVALKILRPGLDADPGFAERFTREARSLAQLNHPGIVTLYEFGRTSAGRYFILMEFVDGMNLRGLLDAGRLAPREALAIVPPLCDALQYAHDRGLVHRDIKPENILIDRLGRVKIADFGIARIATAEGLAPSVPVSTQTGTEVAGTPAYMAPEQKERLGAVDHRADLYALGVVLYQMLTGELPAPGQLQPPSRRVQIDVRLDEIVLRALAKDPALRYTAASEFKTHLETVASTPPPARGSAPAQAAASVPAQPAAPPPVPAPAFYGFSYRSRRTLFGLPLLHIATGLDPVTGRRHIARGIVAIGDIAQGVFALGGVAMGGFTFGGISLGVFSYGGLVLALFAFGGLGVGAIAAFAGLAIAPIALGGFALGGYAFGGSAWGIYASSPVRHDPEAIAFFGPWARGFTQVASLTTLAMIIFGFAIMFSAIEWARKRAALAASQSTPVARISPWQLLVLCLAITLTTLSVAVPLFLRASARAESAAKQATWNLDVIVTDHRAWPPKVLAPERALPVAGATLALLASCEKRADDSTATWRANEAAPHLRLEYPRAAEGKMPDVILVPLPFNGDALWTRKADRITRHIRADTEKLKRLERELGLPTPIAGEFKASRVREITLPRSRPTAYDFDGERFVDYVPTPGSPHGIQASQRWHADQGTDVFADPDSHRPGLLFLGTDLAEAPAAIWNAAPKTVTSYTAQPDRGLMTFIPAPEVGRPPDTRVYRTAQGGIILVQLLRATDSGDVTLRYKTIRPQFAGPLVLELTEDGTTWANGEPRDTQALEILLPRYSAVEIRPDLLAKAASIKAVLEACAAAGIVNVSVATASAPRLLQTEIHFAELPAGSVFDAQTPDLTKVAQATGVSLLTAPRVTVRSGREALITVGDGPPAHSPYATAPAGVSIRLRPTLTETGRVRFEARLSITTPESTAPGATARREVATERECALGSPVTVDFGLDSLGRRCIAILQFTVP